MQLLELLVNETFRTLGRIGVNIQVNVTVFPEDPPENDPLEDGYVFIPENKNGKA